MLEIECFHGQLLRGSNFVKIKVKISVLQTQLSLRIKPTECVCGPLSNDINIFDFGLDSAEF